MKRLTLKKGSARSWLELWFSCEWRPGPQWRKGEVRLGKRYRKFSSTSLVKWRSGCFGEEQTRAPEAQPPDPAFCRFPAQGSLTFLDLPQIALFLPPADRNHGYQWDNTPEVCCQDTWMFIDPKGVCHLLVRL